MSEKRKPAFVYADHADYQKGYQRSLNRILLSFNPRKPDDLELWDFLRSKGEGKQIAYIKSLIRRDMTGG